MPNQTPEQLLKIASDALERAVDQERRNKAFMQNIGPVILSAIQPSLAEITQSSVSAEKRNKDFMAAMGPAMVDAIKGSLQEMVENSKTSKDEILGALKTRVNFQAPDIKIPKAQGDIKTWQKN